MTFKVMYMYFKANNFLKQENYYRWKKTKRRDEIGIRVSILRRQVVRSTLFDNSNRTSFVRRLQKFGTFHLLWVLLLSIEEVTVCASGSSVNWFQLNVGHIVRSYVHMFQEGCERIRKFFLATWGLTQFLPILRSFTFHIDNRVGQAFDESGKFRANQFENFILRI